MTIAIDITGFYYDIDVDSSGVTTVVAAMRRAQGVRARNGGVLDFKTDSSGFISCIEVKYDGNSQPQSRQLNSSFGPNRPIGTYRYSDDIIDKNNRIHVNGAINGLLVWQYYIYDSTNMQKSGGGINRTIEPASTPNTNALADGDRIVWRLVAIFGLNQFLDSKQDLLLSESKGQSLSLKSAGSILRNNNAIMELK